VTDARLHRGAGKGPGRPLLVLHNVGERRGGARWQPLLDAWPGPAVAPDLPGHGGSDPPLGAKWAPSDLTLFAVRTLAQAGLSAPVVVGHGWGAWAAELLGAGGRAAAVVLVDGLGPAWQSNEDLEAASRRWVRGLLDDPLVDEPVEVRPDTLAAHGFPSVWERRFVTQMRRQVTVPVLALESPLSVTPVGDRPERVGAFGGTASWMPVEAAEPEPVAAVLEKQPAWWS
jgi:pimeloyl-ACP methyl ester carboxylesterase